MKTIRPFKAPACAFILERKAWWTILTFLYEFEENLDKDAVFGGFQRVVGPVSCGPAGNTT